MQARNRRPRGLDVGRGRWVGMGGCQKKCRMCESVRVCVCVCMCEENMVMQARKRRPGREGRCTWVSEDVCVHVCEMMSQSVCA